MTRFAILLAAAALLAAAGALGKAPVRSPLNRYFVRVDAQIHSYRILLRRFETLFSEVPHVNVDPFVENLYGLADRFEDLGARWGQIRATDGLRTRHRGMGRVFELFAESLRIHAAALFTRHPDVILAARPKVEARFRSAAYLQQRWAAALQGALIRARLRVPGWLHGMATGR